jgi:hypothetical protein
MKRRSVVSVLAVLAVSAAAWAGPIHKEMVASGAKWVAHLDELSSAADLFADELTEKLRPARSQHVVRQ